MIRVIGDDDGDARSITGRGDDLEVVEELSRVSLESNKAMSVRNDEGMRLITEACSEVISGAFVCDKLQALTVVSISVNFSILDFFDVFTSRDHVCYIGTGRGNSTLGGSVEDFAV